MIKRKSGDGGNRTHERFLPTGLFARGRLAGEWFAADTPGLDAFLSAAIHFEAFYPDDTESALIKAVLAVLCPTLSANDLCRAVGV